MNTDVGKQSAVKYTVAEKRTTKKARCSLRNGILTSDWTGHLSFFIYFCMFLFPSLFFLVCITNISSFFHVFLFFLSFFLAWSLLLIFFFWLLIFSFYLIFVFSLFSLVFITNISLSFFMFYFSFFLALFFFSYFLFFSLCLSSFFLFTFHCSYIKVSVILLACSCFFLLLPHVRQLRPDPDPLWCFLAHKNIWMHFFFLLLLLFISMCFFLFFCINDVCVFGFIPQSTL